MSVVYFLHKETSRRRLIFCSSRSCRLSVLCFVAKRGFLYGFCSDLMRHDDDSRSNKYCCHLCANPLHPLPFSLYTAQCWTWTDAQNSLQGILLPQLYWESSGILAENSLQLYEEFSEILHSKAGGCAQFCCDNFLPSIGHWWSIFFPGLQSSATIEPTILRYYEKLECKSQFHTSGSEMSSRTRRRSRKVLNAGGF